MSIELRRVSSSTERYQFQGPKGLTKDAYFYTLHPGGTIIRDADYDFTEVSDGVYAIELSFAPPKGGIIEARRTGHPQRRKSS